MQPASSRSGGAPAVAAALCPALLALASGCASYAQRTSHAMTEFRGGRLEPAIELYSDPDYVESEFLSGAEAGTVAFVAGDWERSLAELHRSAQNVEDIEGRALVSAEALGEEIGSWVLNDRVKTYQGEGFERVYLHCQLAMAYMALGKLDDVYVETRLSNRLLESEEELYETEYQAGGFGHLISAVTYEILGQPDQAYIDYRRMVEKGVGSELAGKALVRLATELGRRDDLARWEERFGPDAERPPGAASVVVLAGVGLAPYKEQVKLPIPTGDGMVTLVVPGYVDRPQPVLGIRLSEVESGISVRTAMVESVTKVAHENLEDRLFFTVAKSTARSFMKRELTQTLGENYGWEGYLFGNLFNWYSEQADLRCWTTLPDSWQACRLFVAPGVHTFALEALGGEAYGIGTYELEPGETMVVLARSVGPMLYAHPIGGNPLPPAIRPPADVGILATQ